MAIMFGVAWETAQRHCLGMWVAFSKVWGRKDSRSGGPIPGRRSCFVWLGRPPKDTACSSPRWPDVEYHRSVVVRAFCFYLTQGITFSAPGHCSLDSRTLPGRPQSISS